MTPDPVALAGAVVLVATVLTSLAVLWRLLHLGELLSGTRDFLQDWQGTPARPGRDAVDPFPTRFQRVEQNVQQVPDLAAAVHVQGAQLGLLDQRVLQLDARVSDHRRRNEEQINLLREHVESRLRHLSIDVFRAETYRAALLDMGVDVTAPDPTHPRPEVL